MNTRDKVTEFANQFVGKNITPESIKAFYQGLVDQFDLNVHPEDDFSVYIDTDTKQQTFMPLEVEVLNGIADKMFEFCSQKGLDICEIAMPDHMRKMFSDNEQNLTEDLEGNENSMSDEEIYKVAFNGFKPEDSFEDLKENINGKVLDAGYNNLVDSIYIDKVKVEKKNNICRASAYIGIKFTSDIPEDIKNNFDQIVYNCASVLNLKQGNWAVSGNQGNMIYLQITGNNKDSVNENFKKSYSNLKEAKRLRSSEDIENLFEIGFIPILQKMFNIQPGVVNSTREMETPGDYTLDHSMDSVWIDVMLSEEDIATIDAGINKYTELFKQFCEKNGLPGADVDLFTDDGTVMFLVNTDNLTTLSKNLGLRESARKMYEAPIKGKVVMKEDVERTSPNDAIKILQPYLAVAQQAKKMGKIRNIMDSPLKNPQAYGDEVYFSMEMSDSTIDTVEYEFISGTIVLHQDVDGAQPDDDDISLEGFKQYLFNL